MIKQIINQAIPCSLCSMLMMAQALVNTVFAGHISSRNSSYLSAFGMGSSFQNMFGLSIIMGINYAFEIASSQLKGAGQLRLIGIVLNRARFITLLLLLPTFILLNFTGYFIKTMGFKEVTAQMAQQFVMAMFPALVLNCLIYIETMYLNLFEYVILPLASWFVGEICHVGLCYYFLFVKDYGLVGIGYACSISNLVVFLIIMNVSRMNLDL